MGHGGAETDKGIPADIRAELEENRQYLVRALRAVELTTAECRHKAIEVHDQGLTIATELGDQQTRCQAMSGLGECYCRLGNYTKAILDRV